MPTLARADAVRDVVLVHGLYADGSSWLDVIPRLQARGLNVTSVQNPLTTLPEAVATCTKVLDRQGGPNVLAGDSFAGMIVSEAGVHPQCLRAAVRRRPCARSSAANTTPQSS